MKYLVSSLVIANEVRGVIMALHLGREYHVNGLTFAVWAELSALLAIIAAFAIWKSGWFARRANSDSGVSALECRLPLGNGNTHQAVYLGDIIRTKQ